MIRKLIPFAAAAVLLLFFIVGPGRSFIPLGAPARSAAPTGAAAAADHSHEAGTAPTTGLAPSPVVNPPATAARISVAVRAADPAARGYVIEATVVGPDGKPLSDTNVKFFELVDLFGQREMSIGTGVTDGRGLAAVTFLPAAAGTQDVVVRSSVSGKVTAGEGRRSFDATVTAAQARVGERPLLAQFSDKVPYAAGFIVLSVWALIAFALLATARGVISGARRTTRKGEPA